MLFDFDKFEKDQTEFNRFCSWHGHGGLVAKYIDGYNVYTDDPFHAEQLLIGTIIENMHGHEKRNSHWSVALNDEEGQKLLNSTPAQKIRFIHAILLRGIVNIIIHNQTSLHIELDMFIRYISDNFLSEELPLTDTDIQHILTYLLIGDDYKKFHKTPGTAGASLHMFSVQKLQENLNRYTENNTLSPEAIHLIEKKELILKIIEEKPLYLLNEYDINGEDMTEVENDKAKIQDQFASQVNKHIKQYPHPYTWPKLFRLAKKTAKQSDILNNSQPELILYEIGISRFQTALAQWIDAINRSKPFTISSDTPTHGIMLEQNALLLNGLIKLAVPVMNNKLAETIGQLIIHCSRNSIHKTLVIDCLKVLAIIKDGTIILNRIRKFILQASTKELIDELLEKTTKPKII